MSFLIEPDRLKDQDFNPRSLEEFEDLYTSVVWAYCNWPKIPNLTHFNVNSFAHKESKKITGFFMTEHIAFPATVEERSVLAKERELLTLMLLQLFQGKDSPGNFFTLNIYRPTDVELLYAVGTYKPIFDQWLRVRSS